MSSSAPAVLILRPAMRRSRSTFGSWSGRCSQEVERVLAACPEEPVAAADSQVSKDILAVEEKIQRLVSALAESSAISASYISQEIERLHKERERAGSPGCAAEQENGADRLFFLVLCREESSCRRVHPTDRTGRRECEHLLEFLKPHTDRVLRICVGLSASLGGWVEHDANSFLIISF